MSSYRHLPLYCLVTSGFFSLLQLLTRLACSASLYHNFCLSFKTNKNLKCFTITALPYIKSVATLYFWLVTNLSNWRLGAVKHNFCSIRTICILLCSIWQMWKRSIYHNLHSKLFTDTSQFQKLYQIVFYSFTAKLDGNDNCSIDYVLLYCPDFFMKLLLG